MFSSHVLVLRQSSPLLLLSHTHNDGSGMPPRWPTRLSQTWSEQARCIHSLDCLNRVRHGNLSLVMNGLVPLRNLMDWWIQLGSCESDIGSLLVDSLDYSAERWILGCAIPHLCFLRQGGELTQLEARKRSMQPRWCIASQNSVVCTLTRFFIDYSRN